MPSSSGSSSGSESCSESCRSRLPFVRHILKHIPNPLLSFYGCTYAEFYDILKKRFRQRFLKKLHNRDFQISQVICARTTERRILLMSENNYEDYKKNLSRSSKQRSSLHRGKVLLAVGICFLLYLLLILPFRPGNVSEIAGNTIKSSNPYGILRVYYIDDLRILRAKTDTDSGQIYCIAAFTDCDQNEWVLSFSPGRNADLAKRIRLSNSFADELTITVSGYFKIEALEDLPFEADSFFSVYGSGCANADGSNMLNLNADYLCAKNESPVLTELSHPGIPFGSMIAGLVGVLYGSFLLIRNRETA